MIFLGEISPLNPLFTWNMANWICHYFLTPSPICLILLGYPLKIFSNGRILNVSKELNDSVQTNTIGDGHDALYKRKL